MPRPERRPVPSRRTTSAARSGRGAREGSSARNGSRTPRGCRARTGLAMVSPSPTGGDPHVARDEVRTVAKSLYEVGEIPPIGEVPAQMHAQLIRPDRYGEPEKAFQDEVIDTPEVGPQEALVLVMAAGVNFNNVWAARGIPVDVTKTQARWGEPTDFHIGGSDASGVVYKVGEGVTNAKVGDRVTVHAGQWDLDDP